MAAVIYLDTHVVVWLYSSGRGGVPVAVANELEVSEDIRISPMVRLELQYLFEIGRVTHSPIRVLDALAPVLGLSVCKAPFPAVAREAERQTWTRDPFDRLIVAQAAVFEAPLVSKDSSIRANYPLAYWQGE